MHVKLEELPVSVPRIHVEPTNGNENMVAISPNKTSQTK